MKQLLIMMFSLCSFMALASPDNYQYQNGTNTFELKMTCKEVTTAFREEQLILYSVYKNGEFVHSENYGGRFFSCNQYDNPEVIPLGEAGHQAGWMILGWGICGNTMSYRVELVVPIEPEAGRKPTYISKTFISKEKPLAIPNDAGFDIWFYQQNWGNGGTATSTFIPRKLIVKLTGREGIYKGDVLEGIEAIERKPPPEWLKPNFISLFIAGIQDANPELMQYALKKYYNAEDADWYEVYLADGTKEHMLELIEKVKNLRGLYEEVQASVDWDFTLSEPRDNQIE